MIKVECTKAPVDSPRSSVQKMLNGLVRTKHISRKSARLALELYDLGGDLHWSNMDAPMLAPRRKAPIYKLTVHFKHPIELR